MDAILEKLTHDPSPRRHDSSSSRPYPRTRSLTKSNIPRSKSGSDLHSGYVAKDHTSQVPPMHQDLLIPLTNSPPAASQSEQQINNRLSNFEQTMAASMSQLEQINNNVLAFQSMTGQSSINTQQDYYHPGSFTSPRSPANNEYTSWDSIETDLISIEYEQNLNDTSDIERDNMDYQSSPRRQ